MQLCVTELLIQFQLGCKAKPILKMPSIVRWSNALRREGLSFLKSVCNKQDSEVEEEKDINKLSYNY